MNPLTVYETLNTFQRHNAFAEPERQLNYNSEYYHDDVGGYIIVDRDIVYYLIHFLDFDPLWKEKTGYNRTLESDAFLVPVRFVELANMEKERVVLAFVINKQLHYILPQQLINFYQGNNLYCDNGFGELMVPVPLKLLTTDDPYRMI